MVLRPTRTAVGGAVLTCGLLTACATHPAVPAPIRTDPERLVLTLDELPYPGFQVETATPDTGRRSNRAVAAGSATLLAALRREGRVTGYVADFVRPVAPAQAVGPVLIQSAATTFRTAAAAAADLRRASAALTQAGDTALSAGHLGQAAIAFTVQRAAAQVTYAQYVVEWRDLNVVNAVSIEGDALSLDLGYAITLARLQQRLERP